MLWQLSDIQQLHWDITRRYILNKTSPKMLRESLVAKVFLSSYSNLRLEMLTVAIVHVWVLRNQNSMQTRLFCPNIPYHVG